MNLHTRTQSEAPSLKASASERTIEGYASVYGVLDSHGDIVEPGAFKGFIESLESPEQIPLLFQHDPSQVVGKHIELREDQRGLYFKAKVANTSLGDEVLELVSGGFLSGVSIGFRILDSKQDPDNPAIRRLTQLELWEDSIVTFPSNGLARTISVRSALMGLPGEIRGRMIGQLSRTITELEALTSGLCEVRTELQALETAEAEPQAEQREQEDTPTESPENAPVSSSDTEHDSEPPEILGGLTETKARAEAWAFSRMLKDIKSNFSTPDMREQA